MSLSIQGRTAIVTGAGCGIGLAIARKFEEGGANVMFADSNEALLEEELGQMAGEGPVRGFAGDLSQKLTLANLVSATIDAFDRVDILVNAHRMVQSCDPMSVGEDLLDDMLRANMISGLRLSQLVAKRMVAQAGDGDDEVLQNGAIVNVSSLAANWPTPKMLAYSISSAAQAQATRSLASALAPQKIRVNGVAFASIMSDVLRDKLREEPDLRDRMVAATPLGRIAGADELAATVQFLASDAAGFITGQILSVDGGRSLGDPMGPSVF